MMSLFRLIIIMSLQASVWLEEIQYHPIFRVTQYPGMSPTIKTIFVPRPSTENMPAMHQAYMLPQIPPDMPPQSSSMNYEQTDRRNPPTAKALYVPRPYPNQMQGMHQAYVLPRIPGDQPQFPVMQFTYIPPRYPFSFPWNIFDGLASVFGGVMDLPPTMHKHYQDLLRKTSDMDVVLYGAKSSGVNPTESTQFLDQTPQNLRGKSPGGDGNAPEDLGLKKEPVSEIGFSKMPLVELQIHNIPESVAREFQLFEEASHFADSLTPNGFSAGGSIQAPHDYDQSQKAVSPENVAGTSETFRFSETPIDRKTTTSVPGFLTEPDSAVSPFSAVPRIQDNILTSASDLPSNAIPNSRSDFGSSGIPPPLPEPQAEEITSGLSPMQAERVTETSQPSASSEEANTYQSLTLPDTGEIHTQTASPSATNRKPTQ